MDLNLNEDPRKTKTKRRLIAAYKKLIESGQADKLTIQKLTAEARVDRTSFYRHYAAIDDLYCEYISTLFKDITVEAYGAETTLNTAIVLRIINGVFHKIRNCSDLFQNENVAKRALTENSAIAGITEGILEKDDLGTVKNNQTLKTVVSHTISTAIFTFCNSYSGEKSFLANEAELFAIELAHFYSQETKKITS